MSSTSAPSCARCRAACGRRGAAGWPNCCARAASLRDSSTSTTTNAARLSASRERTWQRCFPRVSSWLRISKSLPRSRCPSSRARRFGRCGSGGYDRPCPMLITFVVLYLILTIAIGLWAALRVHNSKDYVVAGRSLPLYMNAATVFATWFGAETVLSVSATFAKDGLGGIIADPFGSSFCLFFVALFFARAFYRMDLLTIGDFYRKRYSKTVEVVTAVAITASYLGWTSAQM